MADVEMSSAPTPRSSECRAKIVERGKKKESRLILSAWERGGQRRLVGMDPGGRSSANRKASFQRHGLHLILYFWIDK